MNCNLLNFPNESATKNRMWRRNDFWSLFPKEHIHAAKKCSFRLAKSIRKSRQKSKFFCKSILVQSIYVNNKVN